MEEFSDFQQFEELNPLVLKFESMLLKGENPFFDVEEYEEIIEHYIISNLDHAEMVVDYALSQYPWNTVILLKKAVVAAHRGNSEEAFDIVDKAKRIDSNNMDFYVTESYIHRILGNHDQSIQSLKKALKFNEDVEEVYFDIAEDYFMLGNINQEIVYLKKCLQIKPDYIEAIEKLFWAFKTQENFQHAVDFFHNLTQTKPLLQVAWEKLGFSYYELGLFEKSIEAFEYSLSIADKTTSFTGIAHSYWKLDLHFQAIAILNEAIEKSPFALDINTLIGWIYVDVKDYTNAQKSFLNEIFLNSSSSESWKGLAQTYIYFKDYNNAFSCISKSLIHSENDLDSLLQLAYLAEQIDISVDEIIQIFNITMEKFPDNETVYLEYSTYLFTENYIDKAIEILKSAIEVVKNKASIFYRLAAIHYQILNEEIGHLYLISGLEANKELIHLLYEFEPSLEENKTIADIVESYLNDDTENEDF